MSENTLNLIKENDVTWVDLRFTDSIGKEQHVTIPASYVDEEFFETGQMFDGSSISGWKGINESDMILMPDDTTPFMDPFTEDATLILRCDIIEPSTMQGYERDPRSVAKRAEEFLKSTGMGDTAFFGPEPEFFILQLTTTGNLEFLRAVAWLNTQGHVMDQFLFQTVLDVPRGNVLAFFTSERRVVDLERHGNGWLVNS